ncbi:23S rRNA (uridine(2552)-2'-O-)-methyltransferase [Edhazardia aedis USNM 41457]|uniref:23S rRNA (Uridine(2552)-2'-O-)-methyltransferase n=1 Tax=Edhazardia aedis (strain USNM 41457) TaxID=1003232 RepID=J9DL06_EDHAE|nr:23S rRNA (uridine(2552)-2'-O-)-methyltransferase [Edhazardia aedis USNM 41457]|eukprot:EJW03280.1 23S rRNA (uridine(2552)-2'-O-)-methyltransferase [Edhazardia aedis USNM 41457]
MGRKKVGKQRLDKYYHLAKEHGYRARSAFKLVQLNKKYGLLQCNNVVDLCAAPGGWLQVLNNELPVMRQIVGIDLCPIKPIPGVSTLVCDITHIDICLKEIRNILDGPCDLVLHDGAPNVGTDWTIDAYQQNELVLSAMNLACKLLRKNGTFVSKVFRSKDYSSLLWLFNQLFDDVSVTKPLASRNESAEIYIVAKNFKRPDKIDPDMFDPNKIFEERSFKTLRKVLKPLTAATCCSDAIRNGENIDYDVTENEDANALILENQLNDEFEENNTAKSDKTDEKRGGEEYEVISRTSKGVSIKKLLTKKNRDGYEDMNFYKTMSFEHFLTEPELLHCLVNYSKVNFEDYKGLIEPEIANLCDDLKTINYYDFKKIVKKRDALVQKIKMSVEESEQSVDVICDQADTVVNLSMSDTNFESKDDEKKIQSTIKSKKKHFTGEDLILAKQLYCLFPKEDVPVKETVDEDDEEWKLKMIESDIKRQKRKQKRMNLMKKLKELNLNCLIYQVTSFLKIRFLK